MSSVRVCLGLLGQLGLIQASVLVLDFLCLSAPMHTIAWHAILTRNTRQVPGSHV